MSLEQPPSLDQDARAEKLERALEKLGEAMICDFGPGFDKAPPPLDPELLELAEAFVLEGFEDPGASTTPGGSLYQRRHLFGAERAARPEWEPVASLLIARGLAYIAGEGAGAQLLLSAPFSSSFEPILPES